MASRITWTAPNSGQVIEFTDMAAGYMVTDQGTTGLQSPPYALTTVTYAGVDGANVQAIRAEPNTPTLGIRMEAKSMEEFKRKRRALVHAMRPKAGPGRLTVTQEWGESRSLLCYCTEGLEGNEDFAVTGPGRWWKVLLKFYAPSPWWLGAPMALNVGLGGGQPFFPFFPLRLAPSSVRGQFTVDLSDSDAPSYPVWTITGPGTSLTLSNLTTKRRITVNAALAAGETMVIDTRPGLQSVRRGDGTNLMGALASDPALWPLVEGVNTVVAQLEGAGDASRVSGVYEPRFSGV